MFVRLEIQRAILDIVGQCSFYTVTYSHTPGDARIVPDPVTKKTKTINPSSAVVNEVNCVARENGSYGQALRGTRSSWNFELLLKFGKEVILDEFMDYLLENPIVIKQDGENNLGPLFVFCNGYTPNHPKMRADVSGTEAVFLFEATSKR